MLLEVGGCYVEVIFSGILTYFLGYNDKVFYFISKLNKSRKNIFERKRKTV